MSRTWTDSQKSAISVRGKTLLVSAAAGSGKTSVLTERIIRSLTDPHDPADLSRMLVVTFTRAAAAELKGRIAEALSSALAETPDNHHLSEQLLKLGGAQISTIDSFFQKLVRANFEKLGLAATFRIADESEILPLAIEVLEGLIVEYYDRFADASKNDNSIKSIQENRFAAALDHLMSNRSNGKLNETLLDFYGVFSSYPEGIGLLKLSAEDLRKEKQNDFLQTKFGSLFADYFYYLIDNYQH
jgi:ATP-dependent helicase/nuclease subunit A